jgi:two-component system sensor histidine kinase RegB
MPAPIQSTPTAAAIAHDTTMQRLKLGTVLNLRWLSAFIQTVATIVIYFVVGSGLPIWSCLFLVILSATVNLTLRSQFPASYRLAIRFAVALLGFDVLQMGAFLFFTGGLDNPFAFLVLAPVLVSASTLPSNATLILGGLAGGIATILVIFHLPLPWDADDAPYLPPLYLIGVWIAFLTTLGFSAVFAFRVSEEARQLSDALAAVELVLVREHHLSALDGLAAAAAHELGTPLGTIAVVARELEREVEPGSPLADDIALIKTQSDRCRDILRRLSMMAAESDRYLDRQPILGLIEEAIGPFRDACQDLRVHAIGADPQPVVVRNPGLMHGIANIVENAVDFATLAVDVFVIWTPQIVRLEICDDGPGFSADILSRLGDPFISTRLNRSTASASDDRTGGGMGLGFFIARTLLMRSGATVAYRNRSTRQSGAIVTIEWPRTAFEATEEK